MLGPSLEKRLNKLGIRTLGQLAALSPVVLTSLFGRHQGASIYQRARGIDPSPVAPTGAAKSVSREGTFSADVAEPDHLRAVLRGFSESVGAELRRDGRRARTVSLKLRYDDFTTISRSTTLSPAVNSDAAIFGAAAGLLASVREVEQRPVRLIGVGTSNLVDGAMQLTLEPSREARQERVSEVFDRIRRKYGPRTLQTGRTAFDRAVADESWVFGKSTGLSAQIK
jgi:DNA polymerase-4